MRYQIREAKIQDATAKTAWSKAREDAEKICADLGFAQIPVCPQLGDRSQMGIAGKLKKNWQMKKLWEQSLQDLKKGDVLFIQVPAIHNCVFLGGVLRRKRKEGVKIVALVHDLDMLRLSLARNTRPVTKIRILVEEESVLAACDQIIVHNRKMLRFLAEHSLHENKLVTLEIFDYLMEPEAEALVQSRTPGEQWDRLIVAGNLHPDKAGYVYAMPQQVKVNLYGVHYRETEGQNRRYFGAFPPGQLPGVLEGGFGLVWDGESAETCSGVYGSYLRYNNPHKTSLYLASGLPVVIWEEAALADFVRENRVGITAASLGEAAEKLRQMRREDYECCFQNAGLVGQKLRRGGYLEEAIKTATEREAE